MKCQKCMLIIKLSKSFPLKSSKSGIMARTGVYGQVWQEEKGCSLSGWIIVLCMVSLNKVKTITSEKRKQSALKFTVAEKDWKQLPGTSVVQ